MLLESYILQAGGFSVFSPMNHNGWWAMGSLWICWVFHALQQHIQEMTDNTKLNLWTGFVDTSIIIQMLCLWCPAFGILAFWCSVRLNENFEMSAVLCLVLCINQLEGIEGIFFFFLIEFPIYVESLNENHVQSFFIWF